MGKQQKEKEARIYWFERYNNLKLMTFTSDKDLAKIGKDVQIIGKKLNTKDGPTKRKNTY